MPAAHIELMPVDLAVTIVDGAAISQPYTATLVDKDGKRSDVTGQVAFTLQNPAYGNWAGPTLTVTGLGAGKTRVIASLNSVTGDTGLTVYVKGTRTDGSVPPGASTMFDTATEVASKAPAIKYRRTASSCRRTSASSRSTGRIRRTTCSRSP